MKEEKNLSQIIKKVKLILKSNLMGIYLHGSVATEGYKPWTSDIDLVIIVKNKLSKRNKNQIINYFKEVSKKKPVMEATFVLEKEVKSLKYPMNFELYFHPDEICEDEDSEEVLTYLYEIKKIGKRLYGKSIKELFNKVPKKYFVLSIIEDVKSPQNNPVKKPSYGCLNLCRTLAFLEKDKLFSKVSGGKWALKNLPSKYNHLIENVINSHKGVKKIKWNKKELKDFRNYMLKRIILKAKRFLD